MALLLEARALQMRFGGVVAVDNVDFSLQEGEIRCLIGPNGAGKSTFFKMVTGQLRPTGGNILFRNRSVIGLRSYQIARLGVGIKTQVPRLFDGLSVYENIWLAARRKYIPPDRPQAVAGVLQEIGLVPQADAMVGQLAHGQRQWVEIGAVLAGAPDLMLLDEPAAGMSDEEVDRTVALIRRINRRCTVVVVEHDLRFIRQIAKTITVFHQGRIFAEGSVDEVLSDKGVQDIYLGRRGAHHEAKATVGA
jgi:branched-chain amino acid transport system ATP-binding protein